MEAITQDMRRQQLASNVHHYIDRVISARTLWMGGGIALAGCSAAAITHDFDFITATLTLAFCVLAQMFGNALHVYMEARHRSGHYISVSTDVVVPNELLYQKITFATGSMALLVGLALVAICGWWVLIFGVMTGVCICLLYVLPRPLVNTPWSGLLTFLLFGPIGVVGCCYAQYPDAVYAFRDFETMIPSLICGTLTGLMAFSVYVLYLYSNWRSDVLISRDVLSLRVGLRGLRQLYLLSGLLVTLVIVGMAFTQYPRHLASRICMLVLAAAYLSVRIVYYRKLPTLNRARLNRLRLYTDRIFFLMMLVILIISLCDQYL